jgi:hypothetical protein
MKAMDLCVATASTKCLFGVEYAVSRVNFTNAYIFFRLKFV